MQDYPDQYNTLIDEETWAFIRATETYYPADAVTRTIGDQRRVYNLMCDAFNVEHPAGISTKECTLELSAVSVLGDVEFGRKQKQSRVASLSQRLYTNCEAVSESLVLFFHGGGFVVGNLESHDSLCADIAARTGLDVLATDYRLLPEHAPLDAFFDCWAAFESACQNYHNIVLCGDSAGGNLCAVVAHTDRNRRSADPLIPKVLKGQVLIYPGLGGRLDTNSALAHCDAPMLTLKDVEFYENLRQARSTADYRLSPLCDTNYQSLPTTMCFCAECDPLADDGWLYCDRIKAAGGTATYTRETGLVHGYLRARHSVKRAAESFDRICASIGELAI